MDENTINEVRLRGRLSAEPVVRELPSGDELVTFRLVVQRSLAARRRSRRITVDTFDIHVWTAAMRRRAKTLRRGDTVLVEGELRRRFVRDSGGVRSFVGVDLTYCRRITE
ncbi:MAG: single-stranded DNA-binding protein [Aeromicrobium sp.]|uniref:single-stranded DNA-binding protein n=1 Tax=Aeromicrobium sp. TaxID=1871063 RepID=UPI0039E215F4